jgi:thymidine phosphorylase
MTEGAPIDHAVGLADVAAVGEAVGPGARPLAVVHARDGDAADRAIDAVRAGIHVGDRAPAVEPVVTEELR